VTQVVVVHERFSEVGGSERVVEQMGRLWPDGRVFAPIVTDRVVQESSIDVPVSSSWLQRLYTAFGSDESYAHVLPFLPLAMATADLDDADVVVTSHHAFANRVRPRSGVPIVSYTHTPARWLWDQSKSNLEAGRVGAAGLAAFAATQRAADKAAAQRVTSIIANSHAVADRVRDWWERDAVVIPPPVSVDLFTPDPGVAREDFFLVAGRLVPYKRPDLAVAAATRSGHRLIVAGDGRAEQACRDIAGPNVEFVGRVSDEELLSLYRRCRALVMPGEEDFGIIPVEAQACGTPIIALGLGGALDSVVHNVTGLHVEVPSSANPAETEIDAFVDAFETFDDNAFDHAAIRTHAESFSPENFRARLKTVVDEALAGQ